MGRSEKEAVVLRLAEAVHIRAAEVQSREELQLRCTQMRSNGVIHH